MQVQQAFRRFAGDDRETVLATPQDAPARAEVEVGFLRAVTVADVALLFENRLDVFRVRDRVRRSGTNGGQSEKCDQGES